MYRFFFPLLIVGFLISCNEVSSIPKEKSNASIKTQSDVSFRVKWHWEDEFSKSEQALLKKWLFEVNAAEQATFGTYLFDLHFYMHRSKKGNEPVPWAHTTRGKVQGVHFHVNTQFGLSDFLNDWTAQHEISHLSIPYVGKQNSWFSEGYATYMQYQVMRAQGVYTQTEIEARYKSRVAACKQSYQSELPLPQAADSLKALWNYPDLYWGGVSFFWELDKQYQQELDITLTSVIKKYVACCRVDKGDLTSFCGSLDKLTQTNFASVLLVKYQTQPAYLIFENM